MHGRELGSGQGHQGTAEQIRLRLRLWVMVQRHVRLRPEPPHGLLWKTATHEWTDDLPAARAFEVCVFACVVHV